LAEVSAGTVPTAAGLVSVLAEQVLPVGAAEEEGEAVQVGAERVQAVASHEQNQHTNRRVAN